MCTFDQLQKIIDAGYMPDQRTVWLGLGITPPKANGIKIDFNVLPSDDQCLSTTGLNVILTYCGNLTSYGTLRKICSILLKARPQRLIVFDVDIKRFAFLKLKGAI